MFTVQSYQSGDAIAIAGACEIAVDVWYVNRLFTLNLTDVRFGSLADILTDSSLTAALERKADVPNWSIL